MNKVIIKCFETPKQKYFYDRFLNSVVAVSEQEYEILKMVEKSGQLPNDDSLKRFTDNGLLQNTIVEKIEHSELNNLKHSSEHAIQDLILQVTQQCNLRCRYCTYSGNYDNRVHSTKRMSYDLAKKAIDFYLERSIEAEKLCLSFYGGEPLLEFELIKKCVHYIKETKGEQPIKFVTTTNGTLLTKEKFDFLIQNKFSLMISIDGTKETHNANRKFSSGNGSFDIVMDNLMKLREYNREYYDENVSFNCVISATTDVKATYEFFSNQELFRTEAVFLNYVNETGLKDKSIIEINQKNINVRNFEYLKMLLSLIGRREWDTKSRLLRRTVDTVELMYQHLHRHQPEGEVMHHNGPCVPGVRRLFVNVSGEFYPCERVAENDSDMNIGSLQTHFKYEKMEFLLNHGKLIEEECMKCWNLRECLFCLGSVEKQGEQISRVDILEKCKSSRRNTEILLRQVCVLAELGYRGNQLLKIVK